jgi:hypothetical protein
MTDILATLDAVIAQIGERRHPQFPLLRRPLRCTLTRERLSH